MRFGALAVCLFLACSVQAAAEPAIEMAGSCGPFDSVVVEGSKFELEKTYGTGRCWGAFEALQNSMRISSEEGPLLGVCVPEKVTRIGMIRIFLQYIRTNPQYLHDEFALVAHGALRDSFPCR